jgi:RNA polymerase sigma-70 factor (ECF subfamily)
VTTHDGDSDAELARQAASGRDPAFTALMRRHQDGLFAFARRYAGDPDAAADIVQETFVAAWKALGRYDRARPFPIWLRAIALNKCRDRARRNAVRRLILGDRTLDSPEALHSPDGSVGADEGLIAAQRRAVLDSAIARLPDALKAPLILTILEGLSQQEAADLLGLTAKAVETRVRRARRALTEMIRER